ncbi:MAG: DUF3568 domain-containing protein [Candidatus Omnitrophica bacterium]|nr:DUF3568 domain-containing protein [Candidatus Omnitrophota bacterium]
MFAIIRKWVQGVILLVMVINFSGCIPLLVGAAVGAGSMAYMQGVLEMNFDQSVKKSHGASVAALKDLGLFIKQDELNRHSSRINFEFETGEKGKIDIKALTERSSKIKIRVGVIGDESKSRMIMNIIQQKL